MLSKAPFDLILSFSFENELFSPYLHSNTFLALPLILSKYVTAVASTFQKAI